MGKGREMGRSVYEQPGNEVDRILSQQGGFQVSKERGKGSKREWEKGMGKGKQKARGLLYDCTVIYSCTCECLQCLNDTSIYVYNNNCRI
jgi:hypothetical protein